MNQVQRGRLIALEGIDGCGKSTQAERLASRLGAVLTFEPGATAVGQRLRRLVLDSGETAIDDRTEALLMAADRSQHVAEVVIPTVETGSWVVSDRFSASTLAYQGFGRGLDRAELEDLVAWATGGLRPDLTVLIDVPVEVAASRRGSVGGDRFEDEGDVFLRRVAAGYRTLAAAEPVTWLVVDGTGAVDEVAEAVWAGVCPLLGPRAGHG